MLKTEKGMPRDHISFSSLDLYGKCALRWYNKYYKGVDSIDTPWRLFGSFVHEVVRACNVYIKKLGNKDKMAESDIREIFEAAWKSYKKNLNFEQYNRAWSQVIDHAEKTHKYKSKIFLVEKEITMPLEYKGEKITLLGRLDRVDIEGQGLMIIDYKTGARLPSKAELDNDYQFQLYTLILHDMYPEHMPIKNKYWSLGAQKEVAVLKNLSDLANLKEFTIELWQKAACDKKFEPTINADCYSCAVKCPLYEKMLRERLSGLKNPRDEKEIIRRYAEIKSNLSSMKKEFESMKKIVMAKIDENGGILENDESILTLELCERDGYTSVVEATAWQEINIKRKYVPVGKKKK